MLKYTILWVDDEEDLLQSHILFLKAKGFKVITCNNGKDAITIINEQVFDAVLLDENMPGLSGLETLNIIKKTHLHLPVIMVTKDINEKVMDDALGLKIADYLIKPINPNQVLLALKKILQGTQLIEDKSIQEYRESFQKINLDIYNLETHQDWIDFYKKMIYWQKELKSTSKDVYNIFESQMEEANEHFFSFIKKNYSAWLENEEESPLLSHTLFRKKVFPNLQENKTTLLIIIDNLRFDQWKQIETHISPFYRNEEEDLFYSMLPTTTQYSRNALFSGLTPLEMYKKYPDLWVNDNEEENKNLNEAKFLELQLQRINNPISFSYHKIGNTKSGKQLLDNLQNEKNKSLVVAVFNFLDMISHAKTEMDFIKEIASDNKSFSDLTESWFKNSILLEILEKSASLRFNVLLTTDHGMVSVSNPIKILSTKESNNNIRYKSGKTFNFDSKRIFHLQNPEVFQLPKLSLNHSYIFTQGNDYLVYSNEFNKYANLFNNSFQHGGISMEEVLIPFIKLVPK